MKKLCYIPVDVCASEILVEVEGGLVKNVCFRGGCKGNRTGLARLVENMPVEEVIKRLQGIACKKDTSCPDQLAQALKSMLEQEKSQH